MRQNVSVDASLVESAMLSSDKIEYIKLVRHIQKHHPTKLVDKDGGKADRARFGICDPLGALGLCSCRSGAKRTTEMAHQLGVGPTLFLMTTKAYA